MALYQSKQILNGYPVVNPTQANDVTPITGEFIVPSGLALNDVIEMGGLAEGLVPVDVILVAEDLDSNGTPTVSLDAGIVSGVYGATTGAARTCGNEFFAANTAGRAGGVARADKAAGLLLTPSLDIVPFGLKVAAAAATLVVGAKIRMTVFARPAPVGM
jgi:hypothetical protein